MALFAVTLEQIASFTKGARIGSPDLVISGVSGIQEAGPGDLSFLADASPPKDIQTTRAAALLVPRHIEHLACAQIVVSHPALAMAQVVEKFFVPKRLPLGLSILVHRGVAVTIGEGASIWPFVTLDDRVKIGPGTTLYPGVFVGEGSVIGKDCVIHTNVTIREGVTLGNRVIIHAGTVIGSDGFGYVQEGGRHHKIPQVGTVVIEDDVELGANVTVDRATFGQTIIRRGTKVDNLVQIAHNVEIGEHNILVSQVGIAGSSKTGHHVIVGGQAGISDHVTIGDLAMIAARSGLNRDVAAKDVVAGAPAQPRLEWLKSMAIVAKLPELRQQLRELEERLKALEGKAPTKTAPNHKPNAASKPKAKSRKRK